MLSGEVAVVNVCRHCISGKEMEKKTSRFKK
jgi:hypothetical protein